MEKILSEQNGENFILLLLCIYELILSALPLPSLHALWIILTSELEGGGEVLAFELRRHFKGSICYITISIRYGFKICHSALDDNLTLPEC
jgi:hypothetical protein